MIILKNITKSYPDGVTALNAVSLDVKPGEIFGVIGESGAGKSTLIRCVNLLESPTSGDVIVDGKSLTTLDKQALKIARQQIAMIFQHFNLLSSMTVFENVALPLKFNGVSKSEIEKLVIPLLEFTDLLKHQHKYPSQLSGGQKQRVAIARALVNKPKLLLCDEATSALDPHTTQSILNLLQQINKEMGLTILLITHEMHVIKTICDRVALLEGGELVEVANTIDFFLHPKNKVAKKFVATALRQEIPKQIAAELHDKPIKDGQTIIRITFQGDIVKQPLINHLIEQYKLKINILQANIEKIASQDIGIMIVEVGDPENNLSEVEKYLAQNNVTLEFLGYVS